MDNTNVSRVCKFPSSRYVVFRSKVSGKILVMDTVKERIKRLQKRIRLWAGLADQNTKGCTLWMITLTYKYVDGWKPNHIREFMLKIRKRYGKHLLGYAWVAELQKRGAVHYHVLLYTKGISKVVKPDKSGFWTHGLTTTEQARTPYYIMKYAGKEYQKDFTKFPPGIRAFAVWFQSENLRTTLRYESLHPKYQKVFDDNNGSWKAVRIARKYNLLQSDWEVWAFRADPVPGSLLPLLQEMALVGFKGKENELNNHIGETTTLLISEFLDL
jgi:hypothetical protein